MFTIIYRRLQKYFFWIKPLTLLGCVLSLGYLIVYIPPLLPSILGATLLIFLSLVIFLSYIINSRLALLLALLVSFLVFFKSVELLTIVNVALLVVFLVLLWFYFRKPKEEKPEVLFPKGWPFRTKKL